MISRENSIVLVIAVALLLGAFVSYAPAQTPSKLPTLQPKIPCAMMAGRMIPASRIGPPTNGVTLTSAKLVPSSGEPSTPDYVPDYCSIDGTIDPIDQSAPKINFRLNIPITWNQKAWHIGGQGMNGNIPPNLSTMRAGGSPMNVAYPPDAPFPLAQGYALYGGDSGHQNPPNPAQRGGPPAAAPPSGGPDPNAWYGNDEAWINLAYASLKKTHDAAMEVLQMMYGSKPKVNYFGGQSHGGREALTVVNRYPQDYDGVLAMAPLSYFTGLLVESGIVRRQRQLSPGAWVPPSKAKVIADEVLRQCDALDGIQDGVINDYYDCDRLFDPTVTLNPLTKIRCPNGEDTGNDCLSDKQIATVDSFHAPLKFGFPLANGESDWPGWPAGAEGAQGWLLSPAPPDINNAAQNNIGPGPTAFRYRLGNRADFNALRLDITELREQIQTISKQIDAIADWSAFLKRNGKLIYFTPSTDYVTNARDQERVYEEAVKRSGQAVIDKGVRYYISPYVNHVAVGQSAKGVQLPQYEDLITILENWVEKGSSPPEPIVQMLNETMPPYKVIRSRPLCRYPKYPRYRGSGDSDTAESYTCAVPQFGQVTSAPKRTVR